MTPLELRAGFPSSPGRHSRSVGGCWMGSARPAAHLSARWLRPGQPSRPAVTAVGTRTRRWRLLSCTHPTPRLAFLSRRLPPTPPLLPSLLPGGPHPASARTLSVLPARVLSREPRHAGGLLAHSPGQAKPLAELGWTGPVSAWGYPGQTPAASAGIWVPCELPRGPERAVCPYPRAKASGSPPPIPGDWSAPLLQGPHPGCVS